MLLGSEVAGGGVAEDDDGGQVRVSDDDNDDVDGGVKVVPCLGVLVCLLCAKNVNN